MKKTISIILALALALSLLTACGADKSKDSNKIQIIATIFPAYDWAKTVVGNNEKVSLTLLMDSGTDLHSYQPTAEDIAAISSCDVLIYVGGPSDAWIEDALEESDNKNQTRIKLMKVLGKAAKEEELKEGMEAESADKTKADGAAADEAKSSEAKEYDEHVWLSLRNAELFTNTIAGKLSEIDIENAEAYLSNAEAYAEELNKLDKEYEKAVASASCKTLLFGDRFPFRYLVDDYGLDYYAAFVGCSAESEASFETISFLARKVDELGLKAIIILDNSKGDIAETIKANTQSRDQNIITMNSMQSVSVEDVEKGASYISIMKDNLEAVKQALQ